MRQLGLQHLCAHVAKGRSMAKHQFPRRVFHSAWQIACRWFHLFAPQDNRRRNENVAAGISLCQILSELSEWRYYFQGAPRWILPPSMKHLMGTQRQGQPSRYKGPSNSSGIIFGKDSDLIGFRGGTTPSLAKAAQLGAKWTKSETSNNPYGSKDIGQPTKKLFVHHPVIPPHLYDAGLPHARRHVSQHLGVGDSRACFRCLRWTIFILVLGLELTHYFNGLTTTAWLHQWPHLYRPKKPWSWC